MSKNRDTNKIVLDRSDGRSLDLTRFTGLKEFAGKVSEEAVVETHHSSEIEVNESISLKRSDGVDFNIIKVFKKSHSDSRIVSEGQKKNLTSAKEAASYHPSSIRIVHMSDTFNFLSRSMKKMNIFLPDGDILIHTGNFTRDGTDQEFRQFDEWLAGVSGTYHYRVICVGNRDIRQLTNDWDTLRAKLPHATHVLCHSEATILGI